MIYLSLDKEPYYAHDESRTQRDHNIVVQFNQGKFGNCCNQRTAHRQPWILKPKEPKDEARNKTRQASFQALAIANKLAPAKIYAY